ETGFVTGAVGTARNGDGVPDATGDAVGDANGDAVPDATTCGELAAVAPSLVCRSGRALGSVVVPTCGARVCPVPAGRSPLETSAARAMNATANAATRAAQMPLPRRSVRRRRGLRVRIEPIVQSFAAGLRLELSEIHASLEKAASSDPGAHPPYRLVERPPKAIPRMVDVSQLTSASLVRR